MAAAVKETAEQQDIIIKAAAVADYRPDHPVDEKSRKRRGCHSYDGTHGRYPFVSGRAQKTGTVSVWIFHGDGTYAGEFPCKTCKKNADMIVANNLKVAGAGFGTDTNVVTLITADDCRNWK